MERKQGAIRKKSIGSTEKSVHTYVYLNETNHEFGSRSIKLDANADILWCSLLNDDLCYFPIDLS